MELKVIGVFLFTIICCTITWRACFKEYWNKKTTQARKILFILSLLGISIVYFLPFLSIVKPEIIIESMDYVAVALSLSFILAFVVLVLLPDKFFNSTENESITKANTKNT